MTYFHTGIRTIIGAESFHCPVRDGKEWYQLAMVIRHNWLTAHSLGTVRRIHSSQISFNLEILARPEFYFMAASFFECVSLGITPLNQSKL